MQHKTKPMKQNTAANTQQQEKQRKFLLILPLLILPFLTLGFYALSGGKGEGNAQVQQQGINAKLPEAQFKNEKQQTKMGLYDQAARDSVSESNNTVNPTFGFTDEKSGQPSTIRRSELTADDHEQAIKQKLAQISQEVNRPEPVVKPAAVQQGTDPNTEKLEKLLKSVQQGKTEDPEMQQLGALLDKIQAIQNPGLTLSNLKASLPPVKDTAFKAIPAIIDGSQKVLQGGVVKLRLTDTMHLKGLVFNKGQLLFGNCTIVNQRLLLDIKNMRIGIAIVPVNLTVYSLDGIIGLNAPEAELAEAAGSGTDDALQSMQFLSMDQSLATQAAGAGISAAKSLLGKKVKRIKVKLEDSRQVLLRNNDNKNR
ncbi:conjugative transposon TraM protein [Mucilaginibacter gracilis]|uniref:Conjugative transposon TraM protein n=2 Tax=Mucilaginibacter gracilis TaxID=423350 RepID=A0A495IUT7_9SPHI|nr:conjugative transposon TraM protein [Mucilaginibacter gracilis]